MARTGARDGEVVEVRTRLVVGVFTLALVAGGCTPGDRDAQPVPSQSLPHVGSGLGGEVVAAVTASPAPEVAMTGLGIFEFRRYEAPVWVDQLLGSSRGPVALSAARGEFDRAQLLWSRDPLYQSWEGRTVPRGLDGGLARAGDDIVAFGDGATRLTWGFAAWTPVSELVIPGRIHSMTFGPTGAVAITTVGSGDPAAATKVYWSADGVNFAPAQDPPSASETTGSSSCAWIEGPGGSVGRILPTRLGFVALGPTTGGAEEPMCEPWVWVSDVGDTWTLAQGDSPFGTGAVVHDVEERDGRLVAAGTREGQGAAWVSQDGVEWTPLDVPELSGDGSSGPPFGLLHVTSGPLGWALILQAGVSGVPWTAMWASADGLNWAGPTPVPPELGSDWDLPRLAVGVDALVAWRGDSLVVGTLRR